MFLIFLSENPQGAAGLGPSPNLTRQISPGKYYNNLHNACFKALEYAKWLLERLDRNDDDIRLSKDFQNLYESFTEIQVYSNMGEPFQIVKVTTYVTKIQPYLKEAQKYAQKSDFKSGKLKVQILSIKTEFENMVVSSKGVLMKMDLI